jgi:transcriptional regulator
VYQPVEFQIEDPAFAEDLIARHPFGVLVGISDGAFGAAHLPFQLVGDGADRVLEGHGAIRNALLTGIPDGAEVLVVFSGPHSYITPGVYRAEPDVPTWNYTAVHVRGRYRRMPAADNSAVLERTVRHNEAGAMGSGWSTSTMSRADLASLARGVVSFRIEIDDISAARKLSQDKLQADVEAVEGHLDACPFGSARAVADDMRAAEVRGRAGDPSTDPSTWLGPLD